MRFSDFSCSLHELEHSSSRLSMTEQLAKLFRRASSDEIDKLVYLLQGAVAPQYEHVEFGVAEKLVFKAFVKSYSLNAKEAKAKFQALGDLGKTVEVYRRSNKGLFEQRHELSLAAVFDQLTKLAHHSGTGSQERKLGILADLLQELDSLSCRYLVRIVVGTLRLGFSDMTVLDALSWYLKGDKGLRKQIEPAFNVRPDLGLLAKVIKEQGIKAVSRIEPKIGVPILMARAERVKNAEEIIAKIGRCAIEPKYDGFRLQIHKLNHEVRIFSRNLDNVVHMFPDLVASARQEIVAEGVIFEGEAVGYNSRTNQILPFQEIVQRKRKYDIEAKSKEIPLKLFAFDLLYHGRSFLNESYERRRGELKKIIKKGSQTILLAQEELVNKAAEIETIFEAAGQKGLEGIMAKKLTGRYEAGARGWNWIKLKQGYSGKLSDTVDCLVMGYDLGKGKRTNFGIGAFLVGIYDSAQERFVSIAKIGTGLTDVEWRELKQASEPLKTKNKQVNYYIDKAMDCDVWLKAKIVVEIRADEISKSPTHTAGLALRFPRLERFRSDKMPADITTLTELAKLYHLQHKSSL